ncbi:hypothetical protein Hanom_Chr05g00445231 [Helianthus anomalus]
MRMKAIHIVRVNIVLMFGTILTHYRLHPMGTKKQNAVLADSCMLRMQARERLT